MSENNWQRIAIEVKAQHRFPLEGNLVFDSNGIPIGHVLKVFNNAESKDFAPTAYLLLDGVARYAYPGVINEQGFFTPLCDKKVYACSCCNHQHPNCRIGSKQVEYAYYK